MRDETRVFSPCEHEVEHLVGGLPGGPREVEHLMAEFHRSDNRVLLADAGALGIVEP